MITFDHRWRTGPDGVLRCYKRDRPSEVGSPVLATALAARLRRAVQLAAAASVDVGAAIITLYGWGEVDAGGMAALLKQADVKCREYVAALSALEDEALELMEGWADGEPADYTAAKAAGYARLVTEFPNLALQMERIKRRQ